MTADILTPQLTQKHVWEIKPVHLCLGEGGTKGCGHQQEASVG